MTIQFHFNALKHKREFQIEIWKNVKKILFEHQRKNGDWIILFFKKNTEEYKAFENQHGSLPIQINMTSDLILIKEDS